MLAAHLTDLQSRNLRPSTIYQRRRTLTRLRDWLGTLDATPDQLTTFLARLARAESRATELSHLRGYYRWATRTGLMESDPTRDLRRPKLPRRRPRPMPDADLLTALEQLPEPERAWLYLAAYAGLRACEISQLRGDDILLGHDPPILLINEEKGGGENAVPICPILAAALCPVSGGWVAPRRDGQSGPLKPWSVSRYANDALKALGIRHTLHTARHWYGTNVFRASGRDLRQTQELLRHRSPVSTAIYTYVDPGEAVETVRRLPALTVSGPV